MTLEDTLRYFLRERRSLACMSIACGDGNRLYTALGGEARPDGTPAREDSLFDLASLTKLFTAAATLQLREEGRLDLSAPVTRYAPRYLHLDGLSVGEVLGFGAALVTPGRIDAAESPEEAYARLYACEPRPNGPRAYSDIHAMVIRHVIEGAADETLMDCIRRRILHPLGMAETFCRVPEELRSRCVSCDGEHRIEGERWLVRRGVESGTVHDPKARALEPDGEGLCGHAGLFSTRGDLVRLCRGLLGGLLSPESLELLVRNRTGHPLPEGGYSQYLGALCYVKHPVPRHSEVPAYMGTAAAGLSGFTGNHLAIDPEKGIFEFYLGSRVMNRLSMLLPPPGRTWTDYGLAEDGAGQVDWPGEGPVWSSVDYVHCKDAHYHPAVAALLGV